MKYLGDCEINEINHRKGDWAYIEDYMFNPDGTMVIIGAGYHTYERCGFVLVVLGEVKE